MKNSLYESIKKTLADGFQYIRQLGADKSGLVYSIKDDKFSVFLSSKTYTINLQKSLISYIEFVKNMIDVEKANSKGMDRLLLKLEPIKANKGVFAINDLIKDQLEMIDCLFAKELKKLERLLDKLEDILYDCSLLVEAMSRRYCLENKEFASNIENFYEQLKYEVELFKEKNEIKFKLVVDDIMRQLEFATKMSESNRVFY